MANETETKLSRRDQILHTLAEMLELHIGEPITTAKLAAAVGVSEAALYRHFPSKAKMFEGLIDYIEKTVIERINLIMAAEKDTMKRCHQMLKLLLIFAERNPGLSRVLNGDALMGEKQILRDKISLLFAKIEANLKQILREKSLREGKKFVVDETILANLLIAIVEGRIAQFIRSEFKQKPTTYFEEQWQFIESQLLQS